MIADGLGCLARSSNVDRRTWGQVTSLRAFYKDGLEVEYGFSTRDWANVPMDAGSVRVVSDGMRILFDPLGILRVVHQDVLSGRA